MEVVNTVGRRKAAVARVFVKPGTGKITVNHKELEVYFPLHILQYEVKQPLLVNCNLTSTWLHEYASNSSLTATNSVYNFHNVYLISFNLIDLGFCAA